MDTYVQNQFIAAYEEAMRFSNPEIGDAPLAGRTAAAMKRECKAFLAEAATNPSAYSAITASPGHAGHDFWFTRNHHGVGFWEWEMEGRTDKATAEWLTELAHTYNELTPFVNRGKVELE